MRLDKHLQEVEGVRSRTYAASLVERGLVTVNGEVAHKVSREVSEGDRVEILSDDAFASRGAYKLKKAHEEFAFDAENLDCADIGCSNGGFTDLLLRLGARSVLAVDVGECALPEGLVNDPRVAFLRANARFPIPAPPKDFVVADLSFISLSLVMPTIYSLLKEGGRMIVDPVMGDNGKLYTHFDDNFVKQMRGLCSVADIVVPNLTEACFLTETDCAKVQDDKSYREVLAKLSAFCPIPSVTGCDIEENGETKCTVYYTDEKGEVKTFATEKISGAYHGAGDVYASALVGALARGIAMDEAVAIAATFTKNSIAQTKKDGTEMRYGLNSESCMLDFLLALDKAAK